MARAIGAAHQIIGTISCLACSHETPAKITSGGKLSLCCTWCDLPLYVDPRTKAFKLLRAKVVELAAPAAVAGSISKEASSSSASPAAGAASSPPPAPSSSSEKKPEPPARRPLFAGS